MSSGPDVGYPHWTQTLTAAHRRRPASVPSLSPPSPRTSDRRLSDVEVRAEVALWRSLGTAAAVCARRHPGHTPKRRREVTRCSEADRPRDLGDRHSLSRQQPSRLFDPMPKQELMRSLAGTALEESREMVGAHVHHGTEVGQPKLSL